MQQLEAVDDPAVVMGVNDRLQLAAVRDEAQLRIQARHMLAGVTIVQPASTSIDVGVRIGERCCRRNARHVLGSTGDGCNRGCGVAVRGRGLKDAA